MLLQCSVGEHVALLKFLLDLFVQCTVALGLGQFVKRDAYAIHQLGHIGIVGHAYVAALDGSVGQPVARGSAGADVGVAYALHRLLLSR